MLTFTNNSFIVGSIMNAAETVLDTETIVQDILASIEREREREIIARRYGLFDRRETLEQIGELLGITRERVRQLEKSVLTRLKASAKESKLPHIDHIEGVYKEAIHARGEVCKVIDLSAYLTEKNDRQDQAQTSFLA